MKDKSGLFGCYPTLESTAHTDKALTLSKHMVRLDCGHGEEKEKNLSSVSLPAAV